jgi:hypothetical protein
MNETNWVPTLEQIQKRLVRRIGRWHILDLNPIGPRNCWSGWRRGLRYRYARKKYRGHAGHRLKDHGLHLEYARLIS